MSINSSPLTVTKLSSLKFFGSAVAPLMFVNISPADYNTEETLSSLNYAQRVKLITNNADKSEQNEEITLLKQIIEELKASGGQSALMNAQYE